MNAPLYTMEGHFKVKGFVKSLAVTPDSWTVPPTLTDLPVVSKVATIACRFASAGRIAVIVDCASSMTASTSTDIGGLAAAVKEKAAISFDDVTYTVTAADSSARSYTVSASLVTAN